MRKGGEGGERDVSEAYIGEGKRFLVCRGIPDAPSE